MKYVTELSKSHKHYLNQAIELAKMSDCNYKHGSVVRKSGRTIAVGINHNVNDPSKLDEETAKKHAAVHAEVAALNACRKVDLTGATVFVARVNNQHEPMMSKPCARCQEALRERGVKKVVYTVDSSMEL